MTSPTVVPDFAAPQVALKTVLIPSMDGTSDTEGIMMQIETSVTHYEFLLCTADNYVETANKIADGIMTLGKDLKKKTRLVEVKGGLPDAFNLRKRNGSG